MAYREPRLRIFQDFEDALASGAEALHAVILGPQFALHRYSEESEKALIGNYDRSTTTVYAWPDHVAGGVIDLDSAKVVLESAELKYFTSAATANLVTDNSNQIRLDEVVATNSAANRDVALGTRDVQVGDIVRLAWDDGSPQTAESVVNALLADVTAGTLDPTISRVTGFGDTTEGDTELTASPARLTTSYDTAAYAGLADGFPLDTYTVRVTAVVIGTGAGNLNGTTFKVTSDGGEAETTIVLSDGNYDVGDTQYEIALGTRGAIINIEDAGSGDIAVEDSWRVTISQDYTESDVAAPTDVEVTGPYTGLKNTQYILTCLTGGVVGTDNLIFGFQTTNGADTTGTIAVNAADFGAQIDYAFGNNNMQLSMFVTKEWNTGDVVVFDVAVSSAGPVQTIVLRDGILALAAEDMTVTIFATETIELDSANYTTDQNNVTVLTNATQQSSLLGTVQGLEVHNGTLFADYREQETVDTNVIGSVEAVSAVPAALGPVSPLNPIAQGVHDALLESNGVAVYYLALATDDVAGYTAGLDILTENDIVYSIVPLTNDQAVKNLCIAHVDERSNESNNQWRIAWLSNNTLQTAGVYTAQGNDDDLVATVEDFPPNGAKRVVSAGSLFVTNGVKAGDLLRINFDNSDPLNPTYDEFVIDSVTEDELLLLTALPAPIAVAIKIEIWETLTNSEYAAAIGAYSTAIDNRRVRTIWADNPVDTKGDARDMFYLCCAMAGLRSGVAPHAPLSEVTVSSILLDPIVKFGKSDFNIAASGGTWLVVKDSTGRVYTRHQLTTTANPDNLGEREDSITTNLDHISREFYSGTRDLIGQGNVSPDMLALISTRIKNITLTIEGRSYPAVIGPQLLGLEIVELKQDEVLKDTVIVRLTPTLPVPLNQMDIYLTVAL
jgi:hypothetical protein